MKISNSELDGFIKTARGIAGRNGNQKFSPEDLYKAARELGLNGVFYLEKTDDGRHVNVLLGLDEEYVRVYDPLSGVKEKPYSEIQMGLYSLPAGELRNEFKDHAKKQKREPKPDGSGVWGRYRERGRLLSEFLSQNPEFKSIHAYGLETIGDLPALQDRQSSDCAPISLFVMSLLNGNTQSPDV